MLTYDFHESLGYWLAMTHQSYMRALSTRLAPVGITYRQMQVLGWLVLEGRLTQADLAGRMLIEPPTLVGVLDRMERAGWIERVPCRDDRRKKWIGVLPAAEPIWEQIVVCGRAQRQQASAGLTSSELQTLRDLLSRVVTNLGDSMPGTAVAKGLSLRGSGEDLTSSLSCGSSYRMSPSEGDAG